MGSGLRTEVASGSSSETNTLAGSGSVVGGGTHTWSKAGVGWGSISVAGSGIELMFAVEDLPNSPGLSGLGLWIQAGVDREMTADDVICARELLCKRTDDPPPAAASGRRCHPSHSRKALSRSHHPSAPRRTSVGSPPHIPSASGCSEGSSHLYLFGSIYLSSKTQLNKGKILTQVQFKK